MRTVHRFALVVMLSCLSHAGFAQSSPLDLKPATPIEQAPRELLNAVSVLAVFDSSQIQSDLDRRSVGSLRIDVQLETRGKYHIYESSVTFATESDPLLDGQSWKVEVLEKPKTEDFFDPVTKGLKAGYEGQALFPLKLSLPMPLAKSFPKDHKIPLVVSFQACSDKVCLFPARLRIDVPTSSAPIANESASAAPSFTERAQNLLSEKLGAGGSVPLVLGILLLAGLITAFTPCVYPLYPITLGIFARWGATSSVSPFGLALSYCLGLTLTYATLGLVTAASGAVFGSLTQTPAFLISMGLLILLSAVFFSGLLNFPMPRFLQEFFAKSDAATEGQRHGPMKRMAQAMMMGAGLGVVASPCVGPVLVALLAWLSVALSHGGSLAYVKGFFYLFAFGVGMSIPFMILGHLILRMEHRPQWGRYTPIIKNVGTGLMFLASLFFLVPGFQLLQAGRNPSPESGATIDFEARSFHEWRKDRRSVLDFRADWCAACVELEEKTLPDPRVAEHFKSGEWDYVRVDMTQMTDENTKISQIFNVVGLPTVLLTNARGEVCEKLKLFGFEDAKSFEARLNRALKECP